MSSKFFIFGFKTLFKSYCLFWWKKKWRPFISTPLRNIFTVMWFFFLMWILYLIFLTLHAIVRGCFVLELYKGVYFVKREICPRKKKSSTSIVSTSFHLQNINSHPHSLSFFLYKVCFINIIHIRKEGHSISAILMLEVVKLVLSFLKLATDSTTDTIYWS